MKNNAGILFIGDFRTPPDEGMRKLSWQIFNYVSNHYRTLRINTDEIKHLPTFKKIINFSPDIVHYITGPTIRSLATLKLIKLLNMNRPITISSGIRPYFTKSQSNFLRTLRPDYFISQSLFWEKLFSLAGSNCLPLPNFTDTQKFIPLPENKKYELKKSLGIATDKPVVLHVGHLKSNRQLENLIAISLSGKYHVVVIGSSSLTVESKITGQLLESEVQVINDFIPNIENIYQASDIYIFPVKTKSNGSFPGSYNEVGVIDFPLSLLEALSANLNIVTTKLDAVGRFIGNATKGFYYYDGTDKDLMKQLSMVNLKECSTRQTAENFDTNKILSKLLDLYSSILSSK